MIWLSAFAKYRLGDFIKRGCCGVTHAQLISLHLLRESCRILCRCECHQAEAEATKEISEEAR